jgi:hypothetical protein
MRIPPSRKRRSIGRKAVVAALAMAALAPAGAQAATESSVGASANFTGGALSITAPQAAVNFGNTNLDGRASYNVVGGIGDWKINDATGTLAGWTASASASFPKAADTGAELDTASMSMRVPGAIGSGPAPTIATGDVDGMVGLTGQMGTPLVTAAPGKGVGAWDLTQTESGDMRLVMPYNTRAVQYDSTITFTIAQGI